MEVVNMYHKRGINFNLFANIRGFWRGLNTSWKIKGYFKGKANIIPFAWRWIGDDLHIDFVGGYEQVVYELSEGSEGGYYTSDGEDLAAFRGMTPAYVLERTYERDILGEKEYFSAVSLNGGGFHEFCSTIGFEEVSIIPNVLGDKVHTLVLQR